MDADMSISQPKTKVLHIQHQDPVTETTAEEAKAVCKFVCPHLGCEHVFRNKHGLDVHVGTCQWKTECVVDHIVACRGVLAKRKFLVRWEGCGADQDK